MSSDFIAPVKLFDQGSLNGHSIDTFCGKVVSLFNLDLYVGPYHRHQSSSFTAKNQYCVMKKKNLFSMNDIDLKFSKIVIFSNQFKVLEI